MPIGHAQAAEMIGAEHPRVQTVAGWFRRHASYGSAWLMGQFAAFAMVVLLAGACVQQLTVVPGGDGGGMTSVFVVNYGWHSGIAVSTSDISEAVLPEMRDFPRARYIELGWGDWNYYQATDPGFGLLLKAALWPTRSVLYLVGIPGAIEQVGYDEIVEVAVDDQMLQRIMEFISDTFLRDEAMMAARPRPGHHPASGFYPARGRFHLLRNCNTWVAEALRSGGVPIDTGLVFTARALMDRVRPFESSAVEQAGDSLKSEPAGISIRNSIEQP